jgi:hypothetical protein
VEAALIERMRIRAVVPNRSASEVSAQNAATDISHWSGGPEALRLPLEGEGSAEKTYSGLMPISFTRSLNRGTS